MGSRNNCYRGGLVHIKKKMCATCIFRPGNKMHLEAGRVDGMVASALAEEGAIVCHDTLGTKKNAVCRGFYDRHGDAVLALRLALGMGYVKEV